MKKLLILLMLTVSLAITAQSGTLPTYKNIKLTQVPLGEKADSMVVIGSNKKFKYIPRSGMLQDLESVLNVSSQASVATDFLIQKEGDDGAIQINTTGIVLGGQSKGISIDGQGGSVNVRGDAGGINIASGISNLSIPNNGNVVISSNSTRITATSKVTEFTSGGMNLINSTSSSGPFELFTPGELTLTAYNGFRLKGAPSPSPVQISASNGLNIQGVGISAGSVVSSSGFIKYGGTSSQFLKADGSIDSNSYVISGSTLNTTGNQSFTGIKSSTNSGTNNYNAIELTNSGIGLHTRVLKVTNNSLLGKGIEVLNNQSGSGITVVGQGNGNLFEGINQAEAGAPKVFSVNRFGDVSANWLFSKIFYNSLVYTVNTLPTLTAGDRAYVSVSDALSPTYLGVLVGGGSVNCPAYWNGTAWVSH